MYIIICWSQNAFIQVVTIIMIMMVMTMIAMVVLVMAVMKILIFIITTGVPRTTGTAWQYRPPRS